MTADEERYAEFAERWREAIKAGLLNRPPRVLTEAELAPDPGWLQTPEVAGEWVKRAAPERQHVCAPPTREVTWSPPSGSLNPNAEARPFTSVQVDGSLGDLWRCTCGNVWRIGCACQLCDMGHTNHGGQCRVGRSWRPASWWQRLRYRRSASSTEERKASVFVQWKGTDVCLDLHCGCGSDGHFDGEFAYFLRCVACGRVYEMPHTFYLVEVGDDRAGVIQEPIGEPHAPRSGGPAVVQVNNPRALPEQS